MAICIQCGKEATSCLCDTCRAKTDLEQLCGEVLAFRPGSGTNPLWENISSKLDNPWNFKNIMFALSDELPTPRKEYLRVLALAGGRGNVPKESRPWFYEIYETIKDSEGLSQLEKNFLTGIALGARYMDYEYEQADELASALCEVEDIPWQASENLGEFYTKTRRYDMADEVLADALTRFKDDQFAGNALRTLAEKNAEVRKKAEDGKKEYMPAPRDVSKEEKEAICERYIHFLASIGIEASRSVKPVVKIPVGQYPTPVETRETDFDTFVVFDLETTGKRSKYDSIIEIGAIKVVHGQLVESENFVFQEFVRPLDHKKVSAEITELTGITNEEVCAARPISEVLPDFMKFAGDAVLVGYNCMAFDSKFMVRAGRYSNYIIKNQYFDVKHYAAQFADRLGTEEKKLEVISEKLGIVNPQAHRALADAITTAKVFLKLKDMDTERKSSSVEELLSDVEEW